MENPEDFTMCEEIAASVVSRYYDLLSSEAPENVLQLFADDTVYSVGEAARELESPRTSSTLAGESHIKEKLMKLKDELGQFKVRVCQVDKQPSVQGTVMLSVSGYFLFSDACPMSARRFYHTMVVVRIAADQVYIKNDCLRYFPREGVTVKAAPGAIETAAPEEPAAVEVEVEAEPEVVEEAKPESPKETKTAKKKNKKKKAQEAVEEKVVEEEPAAPEVVEEPAHEEPEPEPVAEEQPEEVTKPAVQSAKSHKKKGQPLREEPEAPAAAPAAEQPAQPPAPRAAPKTFLEAITQKASSSSKPVQVVRLGAAAPIARASATPPPGSIKSYICKGLPAKTTDDEVKQKVQATFPGARIVEVRNKADPKGIAFVDLDKDVFAASAEKYHYMEFSNGSRVRFEVAESTPQSSAPPATGAKKAPARKK
eukprot:PhM_4_TR15826/c0_g1_i1/m.14781